MSFFNLVRSNWTVGAESIQGVCPKKRHHQSVSVPDSFWISLGGVAYRWQELLFLTVTL